MIAASRDGVLTDGSRGEIADLAEPASLPALLDRVRPDVIINAAAYTAVDRAEQEEPDLATRVINGEAVGVPSGLGQRRMAALVDPLLDRLCLRRPPVAPLRRRCTDRPAGCVWPQQTGRRGNAARQGGADHLILRTAWVYAAHGQNFLRTMLRLGSERDELRVVADQHGAPTDTTLIVRASLAALDRWQQADSTQRRLLSGSHHLVASGATTWHGFASAIFEQAAARGLISRTPPRV